MIKTRFWFELATKGHSASLAKVAYMPFLVPKDYPFTISLDDDGEITLIGDDAPSFDLTRMELSVCLGVHKERDESEWQETLAACGRAGWETFEDEYKRLHPEE